MNNNKRVIERSDIKPVAFHFPQIPTLLTGLISVDLPTTDILMGPYWAVLLKTRVKLTGKTGAQEGHLLFTHRAAMGKLLDFSGFLSPHL